MTDYKSLVRNFEIQNRRLKCEENTITKKFTGSLNINPTLKFNNRYDEFKCIKCLCLIKNIFQRPFKPFI